MIRVLLFLAVVALLALGVVWFADRPGDVAIVWQGYRIETSVMVAAFAVAVVALATVLVWSIVRTIIRSPDLIAMFLSHRRGVRGYLAISRGLIAVGAGDARTAKRAADEAGKIAPGEPLALLLNAQFAQLSGDRAAAEHAFRADGRARRHQAARSARPLCRGAAAQGRRRGARLRRGGRQRRAIARLGRPGGAGIPLRVGRLGCGAGGARSQQPLQPDRQGRIQAPARRAADRPGAGRRRWRARPRASACARCGEARADARSRRRAGRAAARRGRRIAPRQPDHREGLDRQSAPGSRRHLRASSSRRFRARAPGPRRRRWPPRRRAIPRARSPSPARRSTPRSSRWRATPSSRCCRSRRNALPN